MRVDQSKTWNPGLSRHRLEILRPVKTKNSFNEDVIALVIFATVRAQVAVLQGRELEAAQQRWANAKYRIRMQYCAGIEREYTIRWLTEQSTLTLDILDVQDPVGTANYTQIYAGDTDAR